MNAGSPKNKNSPTIEVESVHNSIEVIKVSQSSHSSEGLLNLQKVDTHENVNSQDKADLEVKVINFKPCDPRKVYHVMNELNYNPIAQKSFAQISKRQSLITQNDVYIQWRNEIEALRLANRDRIGRISEQVWYDSLRESDNGMWSSVV